MEKSAENNTGSKKAKKNDRKPRSRGKNDEEPSLESFVINRKRGRQGKGEGDTVGNTEKRGRKAARVILEHCKSWQVYRRRAVELAAAIKDVFEDLDVDLNPTAPRRGSFECTYVNDDEQSTVVWTGIKRGPPRKDKFPDPTIVVEKLQGFLK